MASECAESGSVYDVSMRQDVSCTLDSFDRHIVASIFALALREAGSSGAGACAATGLDPADLGDLLKQVCLGDGQVFLTECVVPVERSADECCLLDLLWQCARDRSIFQKRLAAMVARRSQYPNHLWQDLGLRNRGELRALMARHFPALAARNALDMKWKKFLYRMICADASYALCTAPSCGECTDFQNCFGDEPGEGLLARLRVEP